MTTTTHQPPDSQTCPLCRQGGAAIRQFPKVDDLLKCSGCGFIFADPLKTAEMEASYEEDFAASNRHPTFVKRDGQYVIRNAHKLNRILDELERFKSGDARFLDVGCSAAFFLKLAESRGWKPDGVEISDFGVEFSTRELQLPVFQGTLQEAAFPDDHFDVVFSSHVMEHIADPAELLAEMHRVIRPGGALVTVIPTQFSSPSWRFFKTFYGDGPPKHVSFYSRSTWNRFIREAGFKPKQSVCNTELHRLKRLVRKPKPAADGTDDVGTAGYGGGVFMIKAAVNRLASLGSIGDELFSIGVKES